MFGWDRGEYLCARSVASLHGELRKEQRKNFLEAFRRGSVRVLLVTDVAARGLDIQGELPFCDMLGAAGELSRYVADACPLVRHRC